MNLLRPLLLVATLVTTALTLRAADTPTYPHVVLENSEIRTLPKSANGRDYLLYVALPVSYRTNPQKTYPVIYICDGYWDFVLLNGFYGNLQYDKVAPEYIIVGFGYQGDKPDYDTLRRYDYTPAPDPAQDPTGKTSGHAGEFLSVIEKEFIPFVQQNYRVDSSYRVLGGSSLGGLFTLYALFTKPDLFQAYIAPSPAATWANNWIFKYEAEFAHAQQPLHARLFMSGAANEWPEFLAGIKEFNTILQTRAYPGLTYQWRLVEGERHTGTKAESYNRGIRFAFAPLAPKP